MSQTVGVISERKLAASHDASGWATASHGAWRDQRSFVVTLDDITITPEAQR